jgi:hypothetical protein
VREGVGRGERGKRGRRERGEETDWRERNKPRICVARKAWMPKSSGVHLISKNWSIFSYSIFKSTLFMSCLKLIETYFLLFNGLVYKNSYKMYPKSLYRIDPEVISKNWVKYTLFIKRHYLCNKQMLFTTKI